MPPFETLGEINPQPQAGRTLLLSRALVLDTRSETSSTAPVVARAFSSEASFASMRPIRTLTAESDDEALTTRLRCAASSSPTAVSTDLSALLAPSVFSCAVKAGMAFFTAVKAAAMASVVIVWTSASTCKPRSAARRVKRITVSEQSRITVGEQSDKGRARGARKKNASGHEAYRPEPALQTAGPSRGCPGWWPSRCPSAVVRKRK